MSVLELNQSENDMPIFTDGVLVAASVLLWCAKILMVLFNLDSFNLWEQVLDVRGSGANLIALVDHPHFLRYLVVFPIFEMSDALGLDPNIVFSLTCVVTLAGLSIVIAKSAEFDKPKHFGLSLFVSSVLLFVISIFMNGRMIFGFLGYSLIVIAFISFCNRKEPSILGLTGIFFGLLLCSVSSGVLFVAFFFFIMAFVFSCIRGVRVSRIWTVSLFGIAAVFVGYVVRGAEKNLDYYGGGLEGLFRMFEHGFGQLFGLIDPLLLVLFVPAFALWCVIAGWIILETRNTVGLCLIAAGCAVVGGVFGYSTLTIFIVPTLIMICIAWPKFFRPTAAPESVPSRG